MVARFDTNFSKSFAVGVLRKSANASYGLDKIPV